MRTLVEEAVKQGEAVPVDINENEMILTAVEEVEVEYLLQTQKVVLQ